MIRTDPGSRSLGSDPGIRFWDPRICLSASLEGMNDFQLIFSMHSSNAIGLMLNFAKIGGAAASSAPAVPGLLHVR